MARTARSQDPTPYVVGTLAGDELIAAALEETLRRIKSGTTVFDSPKAVRDYLQLRMAALEHEVFAVLFLDSQHRLLAFEEMFRGTLSQTSVYPREVIKRAIALNAGAVILAHNHPSGVAAELALCARRQAI